MKLSEVDIKEIDSLYDQDWSPLIVSEIEFALLTQLCHTGSVSVESFYKNVGKDGAERVISNLINERMIYIDNDSINLLSVNCCCVIDPILGYVVADDNDGRFTNWIRKRMSRLNM